MELLEPGEPPDAAPTVACIFGSNVANLVEELDFVRHNSPEAAARRLAEVVPLRIPTCLASEAVLAPDAVHRLMPRIRGVHPAVTAVLTASGAPADERPCFSCGDKSR